MCSRYSLNIDDNDSDVIYHEDKGSEECWKCWTFPQVRFQKEVTIENPKYCWMYPRLERKKLRKVVPSFEDNKTLYTKCDFKLESCAHKQILKIEGLLKSYDKLFHKEIKLQSDLIENIWELSFRYMLLRNSSCCIKFYPEIISAPTERRTLCEFFEFLTKLHLSNCRLSDLLGKIRTEFKELDERIAQLDQTVESPFILGDGVLFLPLNKVYEMMSDINDHFYNEFCKLKCWAQLIDPADTKAVEDYKYLLESFGYSDGFLMYTVPECTCRHSRMRDCVKRKKPC